MCVWGNWLAYDILGDLAFGKCFNCLEKDEHRHLPRSLTDSAKFTNWVSYIAPLSPQQQQPCILV